MMNRRAILWALAAATSLTAPVIARAAEPTSLALGTMGGDGSGEPFYGLDRNFFRDAGFDVKLTLLNNTAQLASAVAGGTLEIGFGSVIPLAQAHLHGLELRLIAPAMIYTSPTYVNVIMTGKNSAVKTAADLNGQVVACNGLRDLTQYEMLAWIDQNGGDIKSVKLVETPFSEMGVALETGRIAAATFAEPYISDALAAGQARILGNASECVAKHFMVTGWFATTAWLAQNAETAKRLQTVMLTIARWANANRPVTQLILPKYTKLTPEVAARMTRIRYGETKPDPALIQPVIDIAMKYGGMPYVRAADLIWGG
jgi:NitT/TauT family transport system substrate-binding protein